MYDALGRATTVTDVLKNLTTTNAFALDTSVSIPVAAIAGVSSVTLGSAYKVTTASTVQPTVTAYYDRLGRVIRTVKNGFNGLQIATDNVYNNLGQLVATSLPYSSGPPLWTKTTYDALGRVVTVTAPNGTITTTTYLGRATQVSVDAPSLGGVDPAAQINTTVVDAKGRIVSVWNADNVPSFSDNKGTTGTGGSITFALDGFGRMRTTTLKDQTQTITATYDALGRQLTLVDPDKGSWTYVNSALGHVLTQTDANGNATYSTFDQLGRPLSRKIGDGSIETANFYYYDSVTSKPNTVPLGTQGWIGAPEREECTTTGSYPTTNLHYYDPKGRPSLNLAQTDGKWFYTYSDYDAYSRPRQVRHYWKPSGAEDPATQPYLWNDFGYVYTYDGQSYLTALTDSLGRSWWDTPSYDHMDRVTSVRKGSGLTTTRTYRPEDGVLTAINTGSVQSLTFGFDGLGNLTSRADASVTSPGGPLENFIYDNLNRLTTGGNTGVVGYLPNGNINTKGDILGTASGTYTYDSVHPHAVAGAFNFAMTYDANGNLLTRTKSGDNSYVKWAGFDKPRWLFRTTSAATAGSEFHYNAARSRVMQLEFDSLNGTAPNQTPLHYDRKRVYALGSTLELNYNNTVTSGAGQNWALDTVRIYIPGPDGIIGAREFRPAVGGAEKALVYHYDHLGSVTAITDFGTTSISTATGNKIGRYSEDAWGQRRNPLNWAWAVPATTDDGGFDSLTPRGYTGHEMLDDLGLVHMNGRIYDPLLGRFLSADIVVQLPGDLQAYNRYSYAMNRPLTLVDPSGWYFMEMMPKWAQGLTTALTLGVAPVVDHGIDSGIEAKAAYNTVRSDTDGVATASATAAAVGITRFFGAMDWAEGVEGEKIVVSNGTASTTEITDPAEVASKAVFGAAGMTLTGVGGAKLLEGKLNEGAPKTEPAPEVPEKAPSTGPCFAEGTLVETPDGSIPIEEIKVGETVLAFDFDTGTTSERRVLETVQNWTDYWVFVEIDGEEIQATRTHRFWVESESAWIPAVELKAGMTVRLADGRLVPLISTRLVALSKSEKTFNLGVEKDHDYFVGRSMVLVHNGQAEDEAQKKLRLGPNGGERSKQDQQRLDKQQKARNERRENASRDENGQNRSGEGSRSKNKADSVKQDRDASKAAEREKNVRENRSGREKNVGIDEEHSMKGNSPGKGGKC